MAYGINTAGKLAGASSRTPHVQPGVVPVATLRTETLRPPFSIPRKKIVGTFYYNDRGTLPGCLATSTPARGRILSGVPEELVVPVAAESLGVSVVTQKLVVSFVAE